MPRRRFAALLSLLLTPFPAGAEPLDDPLTCLLVPQRESAIGADRSGIVAEVRAERAMTVKAGDLLVRIDDRVERADLDKARLVLEAATDRLRRAETLTAGNVISQDDIATLRTDAAIAAAEVTRAEIQLARTRITAPFDGRIASVAIEAGELIGPDPLLILIDTRRLKAELVFPVEAFGHWQVGQDIALSVDLVAGQAMARIRTIDNFIDPTSNSFSLVAEIDNADGRLPAGANCALVARP